MNPTATHVLGLPISNLPEAMVQQHKGALFVVNHSGGKDSQALLIAVLGVVPREQIIVMHADLHDMEHVGSQDNARKDAADAGVPFVVVKAKKTLLEMVAFNFLTDPHSPPWPSAQFRQCTSDLKTGPCKKGVLHYLAEHPEQIKIVVNCLGLRGAESNARKALTPWSVGKKGTNTLDKTTKAGEFTAGRKWYTWLAIHKATQDEVFGAIALAGRTAHPMYAAGNERLSCVFCIMASDNDIRNGAIHRPELYAEYVAMEKRTGYSMKMVKLSKKLGGGYKRIWLEERTGLTVAQAYAEHAKLASRRSLPVLRQIDELDHKQPALKKGARNYTCGI